MDGEAFVERKAGIQRDHSGHQLRDAGNIPLGRRHLLGFLGRPEHAARLRLQLGWLNVATVPEDMSLPGWRLHRLSGDLAGHWAIWVNGNWRLTFRFDRGDTEVVDYQDYH